MRTSRRYKLPVVGAKAIAIAPRTARPAVASLVRSKRARPRLAGPIGRTTKTSRTIDKVVSNCASSRLTTRSCEHARSSQERRKSLMSLITQRMQFNVRLWARVHQPCKRSNPGRRRSASLTVRTRHLRSSETGRASASTFSGPGSQVGVRLAARRHQGELPR